MPKSSDSLVSKHINLSEQNLNDLNRAQEALNKTKSMQSRFIQLSSNGEYAEGEIFMLRPGKLKIIYDQPNPLMVVADGTYISYIDRELDEATTVLLRMTKASLLLRENFLFSANDIIVSAFEKTKGLLKISVLQKNEAQDGSLTLIFTDPPLELRKWVITDAHGITTTVSLTDFKVNIPIDERNFIYTPPVKPELNTEN